MLQSQKDLEDVNHQLMRFISPKASAQPTFRHEPASSSECTVKRPEPSNLANRCP